MCGFLFISFFRYSKTAVSGSSIIGQREEGKVKEKSTVLHEKYYLFSYQGSLCVTDPDIGSSAGISIMRFPLKISHLLFPSLAAYLQLLIRAWHLIMKPP